MSDEENREGVDAERSGEDAKKRETLLAEHSRLRFEVRRRLLTLVEHPVISEEFKNHRVVKEWIE